MEFPELGKHCTFDGCHQLGKWRRIRLGVCVCVSVANLYRLSSLYLLSLQEDILVGTTALIRSHTYIPMVAKITLSLTITNVQAYRTVNMMLGKSICLTSKCVVFIIINCALLSAYLLARYVNSLFQDQGARILISQ